MPVVLCLLALALTATPAAAYTANKVWVEHLPQGLFRVHVSYTVLELKELREMFVEFRRKDEADRYFQDLARGADFYPSDPKTRRFINAAPIPDPW